jgi:hypothetical protein
MTANCVLVVTRRVKNPSISLSTVRRPSARSAPSAIRVATSRAATSESLSVSQPMLW